MGFPLAAIGYYQHMATAGPDPCQDREPTTSAAADSHDGPVAHTDAPTVDLHVACANRKRANRTAEAAARAAREAQQAQQRADQLFEQVRTRHAASRARMDAAPTQKTSPRGH